MNFRHSLNEIFFLIVNSINHIGVKMISPLTGANNVCLLRELSPEAISTSYQEKMGIDVGERFRLLPVIQYWRCNDTSLHWCSPKEAAGGGELYSQLEAFDWYYDPEKWEFYDALNLLNEEDSVLEVGVGFGYFLEKCREHGLNVSGVEMNPSAAKIAREKGFNVFEEELNNLPDKTGGERFDVICSFQVLEHVSGPGEFINGMLKNLNPGGRLILSVPNASVMRRIDPDNSGLLNQPPHHMSHWDASVFQSLEDYYPVKVRSIYREPMAKYHVNWIISSYLRTLFAPLGKTSTRILFNRVSLYPVCVLARLGLRKIFPGHTLLVEIEKVA